MAKTESHKIDTIIFDMDGVLVDSELLHFESARRICEQYKHLLTRAEYDEYVGTPSMAMWGEWIEKYGWQADVAELMKMEHDTEEKMLSEDWQVPLVPGIRDFLDYCRGRGMKMAVASSATEKFIAKMMEEHKLAGYFSALVSVERVFYGKPAPDVFVYAAGALNVPLRNCMVIEDSANGVAAAKAAGIRVAGYINPNSGKQDFSQADLVVNCYGELRKRIFV